MKAIIFDSSTLITFSLNGLFEEFRNLKKIFNGKFLITLDVKHEIIDKPLTIKRFELEALKLKQLLDDKVLEMPDSLGIKESEISKRTEEFLNIANSTFSSNNKTIHLIDSGEASCLALSKILNEMKIKNVIAVDERTTRMLGEKPENLKKLMEQKLHIKINSVERNYNEFKGFDFIRSSELVYVAYDRGAISLKNGFVLDALLFAVKFKGCAISYEEIKEIERIG
ncbi:MAG: hypothetical protein Q7R52_01385 [archaeon]|nr:hypothetical protein [archaeon]